MSKPIASLFSLLVIVVATACIAGDPEWSGPVLFRLTYDHGVRLTDLAVAAFAAAALTLIWRSTRR